MRILMISVHPYLPQQIGGRECAIHETAVEMLHSGHEPMVMSGLTSGNWTFFRNKFLGKLTHTRYPKDMYAGYSVFRGWEWEMGLREIVARHRPDAAIIECSSLPYASLLRQLGIPAVLRIHDTAFHTFGDDPRNFPDLPFIAVSDYLADRFEKAYGFRPAVMPPLVTRARCEVSSTRSKVVFVNPRPVKGAEVALAMAEACPDIPFVFFEAWTGGPEVEALRQRAARLPNVEWRRSEADARKLYEHAHTILIPSQADETWGRMATEAHYNGIPVIASRRGGLVESVGPGGVLLDPKAKLDEWIGALRKLWDDRAYYQSLCETARTYANRPEIQSETIMDALYALIPSRLQAQVDPVDVPV